MAINEKYTGGDFTGKTFLDVDPDEFSNSTILNSCFAQEVLYSEDASHAGSSNHRNTLVDIFPAGVHDVIFKRCNLDNVKLTGPPTQLVQSSNRKIRVMNDGEDWLLHNATNNPVEPLDKKSWLREGRSIDPADIPTQRSQN